MWGRIIGYRLISLLPIFYIITNLIRKNVDDSKSYHDICSISPRLSNRFELIRTRLIEGNNGEYNTTLVYQHHNSAGYGNGIRTIRGFIVSHS